MGVPLVIIHVQLDFPPYTNLFVFFLGYLSIYGNHQVDLNGWFIIWKSHLEMVDLHTWMFFFLEIPSRNGWWLGSPPHDETDHPPDGDTVTEVKGQNVPTAAIVSAAGGMTDALVSIINTSLVAWADGSTSK